MTAADQPATRRVTVFVRGRVQGVGFRWWTRARALELGLVGHARNMDDGRVEVLAQGAPDACDELVTLLREEPSTRRRPGRVDAVVVQSGTLRPGLTGFVER
ncbi:MULTISPECIES: acylphosphatase [unclassified Janibacter]|uniref:acylphosphatase n=1 Tax=unclassified Janibacter TaxID=2649294 RepID=UPI003D07417E